MSWIWQWDGHWVGLTLAVALTAVQMPLACFPNPALQAWLFCELTKTLLLKFLPKRTFGSLPPTAPAPLLGVGVGGPLISTLSASFTAFL